MRLRHCDSGVAVMSDHYQEAWFATLADALRCYPDADTSAFEESFVEAARPVTRTLSPLDVWDSVSDWLHGYGWTLSELEVKASQSGSLLFFKGRALVWHDGTEPWRPSEWKNRVPEFKGFEVRITCVKPWYQTHHQVITEVDFNIVFPRETS